MTRSRFRLVASLGAACIALGAAAGGALAHGGHHVKFGKISKRGADALHVEVRGAIKNIVPATSTTPGQIVLTAAPGQATAPAGFEWTCTLTKRTKIYRFNINDRVKARCRNAGDSGLTLTMLRHRDRGDRVRVHALGTIDAFTAATPTTPGTIQVNTGVKNQQPVSCAVTTRTRIHGTPVQGGKAKVFCRSVNGVLTAKHIVVRPNKANAKGPLVVNGNGTITVGTVTCVVPAGAVLPAAGTTVRIHCSGTPLTLRWFWAKVTPPSAPPVML